MAAFIYSVLHMLVDGVCAFAMFGQYVSDKNGYWNILIYNFCAFALQMPLGLILDGRGKKNTPFWFAATGCVMVLAGMVTGPVVLGIGNALFHVGGGVGTIREDFRNNWKGQALGIFVAPGAFGLFIGRQLTGSEGLGLEDGGCKIGIIMAGLTFSMLLLIFILKSYIEKNEKHFQESECELGLHVSNLYESNLHELSSYKSNTWNIGSLKFQKLLFVLACFFVVILRAHTGMAISFTWKTTALLGMLSVLAVVFGKALGGILAARFGNCRVIVVSLGVAAIGYLFSEHSVMGLLALLCFNMTMPITLYLLVERFRKLSGFFFGVLTFGLFLGFLPTYLGVERAMSGETLGGIASVISMLLLLLACWLGRRKQKQQ